MVALIFLIFLSLNTVLAEDVQMLYISTVYDSKINTILNAFKDKLPDKKTIVYTKVPRGLVLSIDEREFFDLGCAVVKPYGKELLNVISEVLKEFNNQCVVESHTDEPIPENSTLTEDWELSIIRANVIVDYLILKTHLSYDKVFPLGFGEIMPFNDNVSDHDFSDKRVDFVIFDYEIKR